MSERTNSLYWSIPLAAGLLVAAIGWWADRSVRRAVQTTLRQELLATLEANVTALEIWMATQERLGQTLAQDTEVQSTSLDLLSAAESHGTNRHTLGRVKEQSAFDQAMQKRLPPTGFLLAQLVNTNRLIVGDSGRGKLRLGQPVNPEHESRFTEVFQQGTPIVLTPFKLRRPNFGMGGGRNGRQGGGGGRPPDFSTNSGPGFDGGMRGPHPGGGNGGLGSPTNMPPRPGPRRDPTMMQVAVPIRNAANIVAGALAFVLRPEAEFSRILAVSRAGESGETYAFDAEGMLISQSRFDPQLKQLGLLEPREDASSSLTLVLRDPGEDLTERSAPRKSLATDPLIRSVADAIASTNGVTIEPFRDYRGVPVVGAWRWLASKGFGVATQIDAREAFVPLRVLRLIFVILLLLLALCTVGMVLFSYRNLVWKRRFTEARLQAKQLGQYSLLHKIGEGGMGVVYKAHHALLRRETAVKLLLPDRANERSIQRFEQEVRLTCRLTHPNTIQVYDYGHTADGIFYYAMEYLKGLNLAELLRLTGPLPEPRVIHILSQVCDSLSEAHGAGLIHRDIKPENIILGQRGGIPDMLKVLDFGLVKDVWQKAEENAPNQQGRRVVGTPRFMPPETIENPESADLRSDLYSVGALGYCLLTGEHVFGEGSLTTILHQQVSSSPVAPSQKTGRPICPILESAILQCLEKDPEKRPQSASDLKRLIQSSPLAGLWTMEMASEWWKDHGKPVPEARRALTSAEIDGLAATLRIDLDQRT